jgi:transposase
LARIGDPHRFKARKQLIRLAGLDLNAKRSGRRSHAAVPVISKRGNSDLRYALYQAALIASYHHAGFRALYHRCLAGREKERGIRTKVRVKLAAKMLVIAWTMMRTETDFDPALLGV